MDIYKVINIEEADYGCEECAAGARALVTLSGKTEIKAELSEEYIAFTGIDIGKDVVFSGGKWLPVIKVAAAVIRSKDKIFATQRGYGEYKDKWEFPGGKAEVGETTREALVREIKEELDTKISVGELFYTVEYDYPKFHLSMDCFFAKITAGEPVLKEHEAAKWLGKTELDTVDWLPADLSVIEKLKNIM